MRYPEIHRFVLLQVIIARLESFHTIRRRTLGVVDLCRSNVGNDNDNHQAKAQTFTALKDSHRFQLQTSFQAQHEERVTFPRTTRDR